MNRRVVYDRREALEPIGWFDPSQAEREWAGVVKTTYESTLYMLPSGRFVERKAYPERDYHFERTRRGAALWLIEHGYGEAAEIILPDAIVETDLGAVLH